MAVKLLSAATGVLRLTAQFLAMCRGKVQQVLLFAQGGQDMPDMVGLARITQGISVKNVKLERTLRKRFVAVFVPEDGTTRLAPKEGELHLLKGEAEGGPVWYFWTGGRDNMFLILRGENPQLLRQIDGRQLPETMRSQASSINLNTRYLDD